MRAAAPWTLWRPSPCATQKRSPRNRIPLSGSRAGGPIRASPQWRPPEGAVGRAARGSRLPYANCPVDLYSEEQNNAILTTLPADWPARSTAPWCHRTLQSCQAAHPCPDFRRTGLWPSRKFFRITVIVVQGRPNLPWSGSGDGAVDPVSPEWQKKLLAGGVACGRWQSSGEHEILEDRKGCELSKWFQPSIFQSLFQDRVPVIPEPIPGAIVNKLGSTRGPDAVANGRAHTCASVTNYRRYGEKVPTSVKELQPHLCLEYEGKLNWQQFDIYPF